MRIYDGVSSYLDVSNSLLIQMIGVTSPIQSQFNSLVNQTKYIQSDASSNPSTLLNLTSSSRSLVVSGNVLPSASNSFSLGNSSAPFQSLYLSNQAFNFQGFGTAPASLAFNPTTGLMDVSFNGSVGSTVLSYGGTNGYGGSVGIGKPSVNATTTLDVSGTGAFSGKLTVAGDVSMSSNVYVGGKSNLVNDVSLGSRLFVAGSSTFSGLFNVLADASFNSRLYVGSDASLGGNLFVSGNVGIGKSTPAYPLDVSGGINATFINISNPSYSTGILVSTLLTASGGIAIPAGSSLTTSGNTNFNGAVSINAPLYAGSDVSFGSRLFVSGLSVFSNDVSLNNRLFVGGNTTLGNGLSVVGSDTSLGGRLYVSNLAVFSNDVSLNGRLLVGGNTAIGNGLTVGTDLTVGNRLFVSGDISSNGNAIVGKNMAIGKSTIGAGYALDVSGVINCTNITFGGGSSGSSITFPNMIVANGGITVPVTANANIYGNAFLSGNTFISGNVLSITTSSTSISGDLSLNSRLFVGMDTSLNANLTVGGSTLLKGITVMNGDVSMNARLFLASDLSMTGNLYTFGRNINVGDVSMNARLNVGGNTLLNGLLIANNDVSLNTRLFVGGDTSLNGGLYVAGKTLYQGDVSLNGRL